MRGGLKYSLQFERGHAVMVLAFDSDLKFKVQYWPKYLREGKIQ